MIITTAFNEEVLFMFLSDESFKYRDPHSGYAELGIRFVPKQHGPTDPPLVIHERCGVYYSEVVTVGLFQQLDPMSRCR
jgi:hypothetical protein